MDERDGLSGIGTQGREQIYMTTNVQGRQVDEVIGMHTDEHTEDELDAGFERY